MLRQAVVVLVGTLIGLSAAGVVALGLELGIVGRMPPALSVQLGMEPGIAFEVGLSGAGPLIASAKVYLGQLEIGALSLRPVVGLGVGLAFLPGNVIAHALFLLAGLEIPIDDTPVTALGELGIPLSPDVSPAGIGPAAGARIDFDLGGQ